MSFLNMFLKILYNVCSQNGTEKRQSICQQWKKGTRMYWNTSARSGVVAKLM